MLIGEKGHQQMVDDQCFPHWHDRPSVDGLRRYQVRDEGDCVREGDEKYEVGD